MTAARHGLRRAGGWLKGTALHDPLAEFFNKVGFRVCFAAGTPLRTPGGSRSIEGFRAGDLVLGRGESDPTGGLPQVWWSRS